MTNDLISDGYQSREGRLGHAVTENGTLFFMSMTTNVIFPFMKHTRFRPFTTLFHVVFTLRPKLMKQCLTSSAGHHYSTLS